MFSLYGLIPPWHRQTTPCPRVSLGQWRPQPPECPDTQLRASEHRGRRSVQPRSRKQVFTERKWK